MNFIRITIHKIGNKLDAIDKWLSETNAAHQSEMEPYTPSPTLAALGRALSPIMDNVVAPICSDIGRVVMFLLVSLDHARKNCPRCHQKWTYGGSNSNYYYRCGACRLLYAAGAGTVSYEHKDYIVMWNIDKHTTKLLRRGVESPIAWVEFDFDQDELDRYLMLL